MKRYILISILFVFPGFLLAGNESAGPEDPRVRTVSDCDSVPPLNKQMINYVNGKLKKQVGTGECWEFAAEALDQSGAKWDGNYVFGRKIDDSKDCVYPGDIIQFEGVQLKYYKDGSEYIDKMNHHTAIVYAVKNDGVYDIAHQNNIFSGRKVGVNEMDLRNIIKGKYTIYRPTK